MRIVGIQVVHWNNINVIDLIVKIIVLLFILLHTELTLAFTIYQSGLQGYNVTNCELISAKYIRIYHVSDTKIFPITKYFKSTFEAISSLQAGWCMWFKWLNIVGHFGPPSFNQLSHCEVGRYSACVEPKIVTAHTALYVALPLLSSIDDGSHRGGSPAGDEHTGGNGTSIKMKGCRSGGKRAADGGTGFSWRVFCKSNGTEVIWKIELYIL